MFYILTVLLEGAKNIRKRHVLLIVHIGFVFKNHLRWARKVLLRHCVSLGRQEVAVDEELLGSENGVWSG